VPARHGYPTVLVRPDGYIAWATDDTDPHHLEHQLRAALTQQCGTPARHTAAA